MTPTGEGSFAAFAATAADVAPPVAAAGASRRPRANPGTVDLKAPASLALGRLGSTTITTQSTSSNDPCGVAVVGRVVGPVPARRKAVSAPGAAAVASNASTATANTSVVALTAAVLR